jgi:branched-chain amino acid transport system substrate-binding protein
VIGKTEQAYFDMINAEGGVNGRKITFISYDDGYSPPKAVEQARKLVESDEVLLLFNPLGTPSNTAIQKYMNAKKVPHLFLATGATVFGGEPKKSLDDGLAAELPERRPHLRQICRRKYPNAKIGSSTRTTISERTMVKGFKDGLGAKASLIVAESSPMR